MRFSRCFEECSVFKWSSKCGIWDLGYVLTTVCFFVGSLFMWFLEFCNLIYVIGMWEYFKLTFE